MAPSRKLELELANVLFCTDGTLLHASGGPRAQAQRYSGRARIEQVTARVKGGLVHLDSTPEQPELATVGIVAENSIMSTANRDEPLFRLDGREPTDDLGEKVRWEGHKVAYNQIKTYRRDEVVQTGAKPRIYDREDWLSAFLPKDESPMPGDVKFLREAEPSRLAWKLQRDDLRLAPSSPIANDGPDLSRIPQCRQWAIFEALIKTAADRVRFLEHRLGILKRTEQFAKDMAKGMGLPLHCPSGDVFAAELDRLEAEDRLEKARAKLGAGGAAPAVKESSELVQFLNQDAWAPNSRAPRRSPHLPRASLDHNHSSASTQQRLKQRLCR